VLVEDLLDHSEGRAVEPRGLIGDMPIISPGARIGIGNGHDLVRLKADGDYDVDPSPG